MAVLEPIYNSDDQLVGYSFYCPGCKWYHAVHINPYLNSIGASWGFNGDLEKPTFSPSVLHRVEIPHMRKVLTCHSFVENGQIKYLPDSTHALAGQTVDLATCKAAEVPSSV